MNAKDLYTVQEAMEVLGGISRNTIYNLMRDGKLASVPHWTPPFHTGTRDRRFHHKLHDNREPVSR